MRLGLRGQLLIPLVVVVGAFIAVTAAAAYDAVRRERASLSQRLDDIGRTASAGHFPLTENVLHQMKGLTGAEFYLLRNAHPAVSTLPAASTLDLSQFDQAHPATGELGRKIDIAGVKFLVRSQALAAPEGGEAAALAILYPAQKWDEAVVAAIRPVILFGVLGIAAAVGVALIIGRRMVARVAALEARTRQIAAGDFTSMPLPHRDDELRDLAVSINTMAGRLRALQASVSDQERWTILGHLAGGLAHQLRNGVAGAKLALQLHSFENPADNSEPLEVALRQLALIETQLRRFLELGHPSTDQHTLIHLAEVAEEALQLISPRCRHLHVDLDHQFDDAVSIHGVRDQMLQVLLNLLENAIDAAGPNGAVELLVEQNGRQAMIEVRDSGPGPRAEIGQRLFDPFVTGKPDGIGLGLAVVRRVVEQHGGRVEWRRSEDQTCFLVELPALNDAADQRTARLPELATA